MSWDQFFLGKEQDQLTRGGRDPAMRYRMASSLPEPLCPCRARAQRSPARASAQDRADASWLFYTFTCPSLATAQAIPATYKPSPPSCWGHQLPRQLVEPGHPSSKGKHCAGEEAVPRATTDLLSKALSALCLNFPRSQLSGEPQG